MALRTTKYQAQIFVDHYLLSDALLPYLSVFLGIILSKTAFHLTEFLSTAYFKGYASLNKIQCVEWKNRGMSSAHAIFITIMSFAVLFSGLFSENLEDPITFRSSHLSIFVLGMSVGYFITDLAMILWFFPSLGGLEFVFHHTLSAVSISYTLLSGEGQFYTFMILLSEATTPEINLRWFLDIAGLKSSPAYLVNGLLIFLSWLVTRILLFTYVFYHIYSHYKEILQMHTFGYCLILGVPALLFVMNLYWFIKIVKGIIKTLSNRSNMEDQVECVALCESEV